MRLMGRGRLRFPTPPQQLPRLTKDWRLLPCHHCSYFASLQIPFLPVENISRSGRAPPLFFKISRMAFGKTKPAAQAASSSPSPAPTLITSSITEEKHLAAALPLTVSDHNEWNETMLLAGSAEQRTLVETFYPFFLHSVFAELVPPFFKFFTAILHHYQVQALHFQPNSILLLSIFAFYCEAFVGVRPFVPLLRHFFSLRLQDPTQRSGCVSFVAVHKSNVFMRDGKVGSFRRPGVFMDARGLNARLELPT